jgi:RNA polymerase sigma-70 factor (ECF subfamily)
MSAAAIAPVSLHLRFPFGKSKSSASWEGENQEQTKAARPLDAESNLIARCLGGEQGAWEELVQVHTKRVYAICYRFTNSDSEAQDLTQEVFLRIFRTLGSFRAGEGSFTVWLTRLTRNLLVDHYRRTKQERVTDAIEEKLTVLEEKTAQHSRTDGISGNCPRSWRSGGNRKVAAESRTSRACQSSAPQ